MGKKRRSSLKIKVKFFAYLRELFQGKEREVRLKTGATVCELLELLCDSPECRKEIFNEEKLKPHIVIFKNGASIHTMSGLDTELDEGDTIAVFPFIGGG